MHMLKIFGSREAEGEILGVEGAVLGNYLCLPYVVRKRKIKMISEKEKSLSFS